jgi:signal peptidase I
VSQSTAHLTGWRGHVNGDVSPRTTLPVVRARRQPRAHAGVLICRSVTAALVIVLAVACVVFRPRQLFDGPVEYVVVAGNSMKPHFAPGDLVIVRRAASYHVGDVIAYTLPKGSSDAGHHVIHRIVGGSARTGWITRGDGRDFDDAWRIPNGNVLGQEWIHLPAYRYVNEIISARVLVALVIGLAVTIFAWPGAASDGLEPDANVVPLTRRERRLRRRRLARWRSLVWH